MSKKASARKTDRRAKTTQSRAHVPPLGLKIIVQAIDSSDEFRTRLATADVAALRFLTAPDIDGESGLLDAIDQLAEEFGSEQLIVNAIQGLAKGTHDVRGRIFDGQIAHREAALLLGLCIGYRAAAGR